MNRSFAALERQRLARCRLLAELRYRRLPRPGGWSHCGEQFGTEPTSLALLALHSSSSASTVTRKELEPLLGVSAAEWAVAGCRERDGGRQFLGKRRGSQHADDFGRCSRDVRRGARQFG